MHFGEAGECLRSISYASWLTVVGRVKVKPGGSDGCVGLNRARLCGRMVATEWSDCWTQAELRFDPDAAILPE
jgi:hypothetical protein